MSESKLRVRYAPSPTGHLHVGGARTALFNWLLARQAGGTFVLRIEDTDRERHVEGADARIMDDLRWLGLHWDEGVGVGGPHGPYYQMQRLDLYRDHVRRLLDDGNAYYAFETPEELEAMRERATAERRAFRYPRPPEPPTEADAEHARKEGRPVVVRFRMPDTDITVHDLVMGDVTIAAAELDDFIVLKADGVPTYHLANVVDDSLMKITHILRGQEFLAQTPRHIALQRALGYPTPVYAHLPLIMDMKGRKLSKRDGDVEVHAFRQAGYLPETMCNFLALLGWSPGDDREKMTLDDMVQLFSVERINRTNARFDRDKLLAFNTDAIAAATPERRLAAFKDYLAHNETPIAGQRDETLIALLNACEGLRTFRDVDDKCAFLFRPDDAIEYDEAAVQKVLRKDNRAGMRMLDLLRPRFEALEPWTAPALEAMLQAVCGEQGVGMGKVAQPVRVAVSGTAVSPPIFDTLAILGKAHTVARIRRCLERG